MFNCNNMLPVVIYIKAFLVTQCSFKQSQLMLSTDKGYWVMYSKSLRACHSRCSGLEGIWDC